MTALDLMSSLLEDDPDDVDVNHYLGMVNTGSVEEVLANLGFKKTGRYEWHLEVPVRHQQFATTYGARWSKASKLEMPDSYEAGCRPVTIPSVGIHVGPAWRHDNGNSRQCTDEISWRMDVSFLCAASHNVYNTRHCEALGLKGESSRGSLAARLNHVIRFLIDAIQAADNRKHTDATEFCRDIDKTWGKQPNRWIVRNRIK